jgi:molybdenum cofactor guanylyltransferase
MGRDKALLPVGGVMLTEIVAEALRKAGATDVLAIGGDQKRLRSLGVLDEVVADEFPGQGPLGGIISALKASSNDLVVVLACDTPAIDADTPSRLLTALHDDERAAVAVAVVDERVQPLTAAWRRSLSLDHLRRSFESGERAPRKVLDGLRVRTIEDISPDAVLDLDSPEDLDRYAQWSSSESKEEP